MERVNTRASYRVRLAAAVALLIVAAIGAGYIFRYQPTPTEAAWYSTDGTWLYRKTITIDHTRVSGSSMLSSFPVLVSVTDPDLKSTGNGGNVGKSDGTDIFFTDADGTTKLAHEIESYDATTGTLVVWVNVPSLSPTTDTVIYMYYGNASASDMQTVAPTKTAVWSSNYKAVWHLSETPAGTTGEIKDGTGVNNGTTHNMTSGSQTAGKINGSLAFVPSSSQYIDVPSDASIRITNNLSLSFWVNPTGTNSLEERQIAKDSSWYTKFNTNSRFPLFAGYVGGITKIARSPTAISAGQWTYVTFTFADGITTIYVNGSSVNLDTNTFLAGDTLDSTSFSLFLGSSPAPDSFAQGGLDEMRVSKVVRSADWIATEYNNQSSPSTFYSFGNEGINVNAAVKITGTANSIGWYATGGTWTYRKMLTINKDKVSGGANLANFPVLVSVTDPDLKSTGNGGKVGKSDGTDIFFTDADGTTKLAHEIESYSPTTGALVAWVSVPTLSALGETRFYLYFSNASASDMQTVAPTKTAVWESDYVAVYHLPNGTTLSANDSTGNAYNGTVSSVSATPGTIDGAAGFAGTASSYIYNHFTWPVNFVTFSTWAKRGTNAASSETMMDQGFGWIYLNLNDTTVFFTISDTTCSAAFAGAYNNWHHYAGTYSSTTNQVKLYIDGTPVSTCTANARPFAGQARLTLGSQYSGSAQSFNGYLDEARASKVARSADWIKTEYTNQSSPSTFVVEGGLQTETRQNSSGEGVPTVKVRGGVKFR